MNKYLRKLTLVIGLLVSGFISAETLTGKVIAISDGDTIKILVAGNQQVKVRLAEVDAPESSQAFGQESKKSLSNMCFGKNATVNSSEKDRYGRTVGYLVCDGKDANLAQLSGGYAWFYKQYGKKAEYRLAAEQAKSQKLGLWADPHPTPPWEYRHGGANKSNQAETGAKDEVSVKKSKNNICHDTTSQQYNQTKNFTPFQSMEECLASGGRRPYK